MTVGRWFHSASVLNVDCWRRCFVAHSSECSPDPIGLVGYPYLAYIILVRVNLVVRSAAFVDGDDSPVGPPRVVETKSASMPVSTVVHVFMVGDGVLNLKA